MAVIHSNTPNLDEEIDVERMIRSFQPTYRSQIPQPATALTRIETLPDEKQILSPPAQRRETASIREFLEE